MASCASGRACTEKFASTAASVSTHTAPLRCYTVCSGVPILASGTARIDCFVRNRCALWRIVSWLCGRPTSTGERCRANTGSRTIRRLSPGASATVGRRLEGASGLQGIMNRAGRVRRRLFALNRLASSGVRSCNSGSRPYRSSTRPAGASDIMTGPGMVVAPRAST